MVVLLKIKSAWYPGNVFLFVAGLLLAFTASTSIGATRGISVAVRQSELAGAPVSQNVELYSSSYALVIGNDLYNNGWPALSNAVKDAELVADALEERGFEVDLHRNLTSSELNSAFKRFFILQGDDPEARLFVWYAGHGATVEGEGYLIPIDAPIPSVGSHFKLASTPLRDFGTYMRQSVSKHVFAVFDSCFAGTVFSTQRSIPPAAITLATTKPVRQFLTSGDADQTVSDDGNFRDLFIKAISGEERSDLNSDGYVTASELGMFLGDRVTNLTQSMQTPRYGKLRDKKYDRGDFVFKIPDTASILPRIEAESSGTQQSSAEIEFWNSIKDSKSAEQYGAYLKTYPGGSFATLAVIRKKAFSRPVASVVELAPNDFEVDYKDEDHVALGEANIRNLPYKRAEKIGQLEKGELIWVIGETRFRDETWFRIARNGMDFGFVHASLLEQSEQRYASETQEVPTEQPVANNDTEDTASAPLVEVESNTVKGDRWSVFADELGTEFVGTDDKNPAGIASSMAVKMVPADSQEQAPSLPAAEDLLQQFSSVSDQHLVDIEPYLKAALEGDIEKQFLVGYMYQYGMKTEINPVEALYWYEKAASAGHVDAQLNLGLMNENGKGQQKNLQRAIYWYGEAATQGNADAQQLLGYFYETGQGVNTDFVKAVEYYTAAAKQGEVIAQVNLGRIYHLGLAGEFDNAKAKYWYEQAASQGNEDARIQLALLTE